MKLAKVVCVLAALTFTGPAFAQSSTSSSDANDATKISCADFLVLDTPKQGTVLLPILPSKNDGSSSSSSSNSSGSSSSDSKSSSSQSSDGNGKSHHLSALIEGVFEVCEAESGKSVKDAVDQAHSKVQSNSSSKN